MGDRSGRSSGESYNQQTSDRLARRMGAEFVENKCFRNVDDASKRHEPLPIRR